MGFRNLHTWQQANEILELLETYITTWPKFHSVTNQPLRDLIDQMVRSARSVIRNIEEGYARNTTEEYITFLGYSIASLQELIGDIEYCIKGKIGGDKGKEGRDKLYYLTKGEAKMLFSQIKALEKKMGDEKTIPASELARRALMENQKKEKEFDKFIAETLEAHRKKVEEEQKGE